MTLLDAPANFGPWVNMETGETDRRMFTDPTVFELEMERIFYRAWNFVAHESQIPNPGDFFRNFIGESDVIVVRDSNQQVQVLVNSCRHRGNAICRADEGHASSFMCTYHGWTYSLEGTLVGVPGFKQFYHEQLDRSRLGLVKAAQVDTYKGFVFATFDPEAPGLDEYLGDVGKIGLSMIAERGEDVRIVGGVQRYTIPCNWKFAVDNNPDWYHVRFTHGSAMLARGDQRGAFSIDTNPMISLLGEYGHIIGGPATTLEIEERIAWWRDRDETKAALGPVGMKSDGHPNIFPNSWIATTTNQLVLRIPRSPVKTEIWLFTLIDHSLLDRDRGRFERMVNGSIHGHGPSGFFEQDDGENWDMSTRAMKGVAKDFPLDFSMDLGLGKVINDESGPPHIEGGVNEHPQLWQWRCWVDWMSAPSWNDLRVNHIRPSVLDAL